MQTLADVARTITTQLGTSHDEALTLATTYAIQLDLPVPTQEGGQAPGYEVTDDDARIIVEAATEAAAQ